MVITKDKLQLIVNDLPDKVDLEDAFDKMIMMAKIEQALLESEQGLGQEWEEFKIEWQKEDQ
jgi:hypothetical protein